MRITRDLLIRIAREEAQKRALADPSLIAAYLVGSLRTQNPLLGNTTDIDIIMVHTGQPAVPREVLPLSTEISLDISHNPRSEYEKPKELRINPWLGPDLYDPLPLYGTSHFFEFIQAGVRAGYDDPPNVLARSLPVAAHARQIWSSLQASRETGPQNMLRYLKCIVHAVNAVALLSGSPLSERRLLLQFEQRAALAGLVDLPVALLNLLGASRITPEGLRNLLAEWEKDISTAASLPEPPVAIRLPRLPYYQRAMEAMLNGDSPHSILWPLLHTWTVSASALQPSQQGSWLAGCETLGLTGEVMGSHLSELDVFLDAIEEHLENLDAGGRI